MKQDLITPNEMIKILSKNAQIEAEKFILLGEQLNCKPEIRYAHVNKYWRCVFKNKELSKVLFVVECTNEWWRVKAILSGIALYIDKLEMCSESLKTQIITAYDCHRCNTYCKGGNPYIYKDTEYRKCIGCSYYFQNLNEADWDSLISLIQADAYVMQST